MTEQKPKLPTKINSDISYGNYGFEILLERDKHIFAYFRTRGSLRREFLALFEKY